ncbi:MAG TPA: energy transducer TonB [Thermoanaerobaculia bacterium]|jgi:TonB family protein
MTERKSCIRCDRSIDEYAKACPFCNWDQTQIPPRVEEPTEPVYVPPPDNRARTKILGIVAFVALVIIAFVVGMLIHGFEPNEVKAAQMKNGQTSTALTPSHRSNVTLVPVEGSDVPQSIEQPITSAPPQAPGQQPNDATALPADQYAAAAARAKAEREAAAKAQKAMIDPRSLTGPAYERPAKPIVRSERVQSESALEGPPPTERKTAAFLEYKPLPRIAVDHDITARVNLTVDSDGRVTDIDVNESIPDMPKLIAAIQNWRFKPATENGNPVTARVAVDITFRANE